MFDRYIFFYLILFFAPLECSSQNTKYVGLSCQVEGYIFKLNKQFYFQPVDLNSDQGILQSLNKNSFLIENFSLLLYDYQYFDKIGDKDSVLCEYLNPIDSTANFKKVEIEFFKVRLNLFLGIDNVTVRDFPQEVIRVKSKEVFIGCLKYKVVQFYEMYPLKKSHLDKFKKKFIKYQGSVPQWLLLHCP